MFELVRTLHEVFRVESTWGFALVIAFLFAVVGGGLGYLVDRTYKNAVTEVSATSVVTEADIARRRQLRNQIGDLIQRGRIFQSNLLSLAQGQLPNPMATASSLVQGISPWHMEVIRLAEMNISHADAMRVSVPPPDLNRPQGLMANVQQDANGKSYGGYDLRTLWDWVVGDLASLDRFLDQLPELRP